MYISKQYCAKLFVYHEQQILSKVAKVGGGVAVEFNLSCFASNVVYFNNTKFTGNHVESGSGGAIAVMPCTGTELHINGSKFHNNAAYYDKSL